jgi:glycosyltransferase involved in cell wall biosynthesis
VVQFLGQRNDARDWLAGLDVFVNSSTSEGVSLTILEAMAAGLPVVVTAVGGTPEVVTPECGRLVPPRQPQAIADALVALGSDRAQAAAMGRAGRARAEARFTLDRMIADYRSVYLEVA